MTSQTITLRSYRNLRAYRRASALASDIFWITRRFPRDGQNTLSDQMRRHAHAIPEAIARGWHQRHDPCAFTRELDVALNACHQLSHWLNVAKACQCLTMDEHHALMARKKELHSTIAQLRARCGMLCE